MRSLKLKDVVVLTALSAVILTGCTAHEDLTINDYQEPTTQVQEFKPVTPNLHDVLNQAKEDKTNTEQQPTVNQEYNTKEFTFFQDAKQEIIEYIESEEFEQLKQKGKYYVTTGIDFVFFDTEINGITFDEMSAELKIRVMNDIASLDSAVEAYFPGYKESLSSKYQIAAEFVSSKYLDILDAIKEYLGEEKYNALGETKDQIIGDISDIKDEAIEDIKELYKSWRNN